MSEEYLEDEIDTMDRDIEFIQKKKKKYEKKLKEVKARIRGVYT